MNGHIVYGTKFSTDIDRFQTVAENTALTKNDLRVFLFLCCRMGSKHLVKIDKPQIAESLCMNKKKVTDAIDNLIYHNVIVRDSDEHTKSGYKMCYTGNDNF